jgi:hypothetical protein
MNYTKALHHKSKEAGKGPNILEALSIQRTHVNEMKLLILLKLALL